MPKPLPKELIEIRWLSLTALILTLACAASNKLDGQRTAAAVAVLQSQIDAILQEPALQQSRAGIKVVSLSNGEVLYARDSHLLFHPASNMKLLTTAAALSRLGPNFRFGTTLSTDVSAFADSVLSGHLYLKGGGDPSLRTEDLWHMVQKLKSLGVRRITGDLICDESYLDDIYLGAGWMWDDASSKYWPPVSALTVNRNCVTVTVAPGSRVGDSLRVYLDPITQYVSIENAGTTAAVGDSLRLQAFKVERKWRERENTIKIEGSLTPHGRAEQFIIEIAEPALYVGTLFAEILTSEEMAFSGSIKMGVAPDTTEQLFAHRSEPLSVLIAHTNKESDNLYAELILKALGAEIMEPPGSAKKGLTVVNRFLAEIGVDTTAFALADGSGVSRYNVISPDHIVELLAAMQRDFRVRAEFETSLPIAGVDGTLKNRMQDTPAEGKLRAKTGTLRGVSALSGYVPSQDGELLAFSMITEHFVVPTSEIRAIQDRIGALLASFSRRPKVAGPQTETSEGSEY